MTFSIGHVAGGTGAGRKRQKPAPKPWTCKCGGIDFTLETPQPLNVQPAYMSRCPDCKTERP